MPSAVTRLRAIWISSLAVLCAGCGGGLAPTVTCSGLRAVSLGMSEEVVVKTLGPPIARIPGHECAIGPDSECWRYHHDGVGPVLWVEMHKQKGLTSVAAFYSQWFKRDETLLLLDAHQAVVGKTFASRLQCDR